ncbi:MAG: hypothetical protein ACRDP1_12105 [Nocardioidaceae bacterium]
MPALTWKPSPGTTQYEVQVDTDPGFTNPSVDTSVQSTTYTVSTPQAWTGRR